MASGIRSRSIPPSPSDGIERRVTLRHVPAGAMSCHLISLVREEHWPAEVRNLSLEGIGLTVQQELGRGAVVGIHLTNAGGTYSRFLLVQVRHTLKEDNGRYLVGGEFVGQLTEEELRVLLPSGLRSSVPAEQAE